MTPIPDDATGEALRQLEERGSDLTKPMEIDFFVAVPSEEAGHKVAAKAQELGFTTSVEQDEEFEDDEELEDDEAFDDNGTPKDDEEADGDAAEELSWTCYCTKTFVPDYSEVVRIEEQLNSIAKEFGGYGDGFGSFGNAEEDEDDEDEDEDEDEE
jgi:regulator of RNase E activity RraB